MHSSSAPSVAAAPSDAPGIGPRVRDMLERRTRWLEALIVLAVAAVFFIVLGFLAAYFREYFHLILMFGLAGLLAFLISPVADFLQRRLTRLPRALAVVAVIVPVILILAIVAVRVVVSLTESFVQLAAALPGLIATPPAFLTDLQSWLAGQGINVDVVGAFQSLVTGLLQGLTDLAVTLFSGFVGAIGTFIDAIIVVSLAVFIAIDRDKILRLGIDMVPPDRRPEALLFRQRVVTAFTGFIRSQIYLGGLYGIWALVVSFIFGLPFGVATAFLAAVIMAIPIYGPYVSWLPPVLVALLTSPELALPVAAFMLVGWFIDENILAPLVRAGALELNPIVVTFAFLLGAQLAGAIGAIVAIPMAAVIQAFLIEYVDRYRTERGWPSDEADPGGGGAEAAGPVTTPAAQPIDGG